MTFDENARQAKRSLYGVMVTRPSAIDCMSPVNRKYISYHFFHINYHYSVFFRSSNDFCDPPSRYRYQNIPTVKNCVSQSQVDDLITHPASNFLCIPHPASMLSPILHPAKPMLDPLLMLIFQAARVREMNKIHTFSRCDFFLKVPLS